VSMYCSTTPLSETQKCDSRLEDVLKKLYSEPLPAAECKMIALGVMRGCVALSGSNLCAACGYSAIVLYLTLLSTLDHVQCTL
jgi:hypothetical protein